MKIEKQLLDKYNVPTPRYTSYPPANFFLNKFEYADCEQALIDSNKHEPQNISFYIHIPFCSKLCFYCGCNTLISRDKDKIRNYIDSLIKEIQLLKSTIDTNREVSQIHWGGGTPNYLPVEYIREIMDTFYAEFKFTDNAEIAIECHPGHLTLEYADELVDMGFNRLSLGVQDFNLDVLKAINREPSLVPVKELHDYLKYEKKVSVNLDFIYGLPLQTPESFRKTMEEAADISPDRLVTFSYAHVPWIKKAQTKLEKYGLPTAEEKVHLFEIAYEVLTQNGYGDIGLDHFAKPDDELSIALKNRSLHRNFQGYCTRETTGQVYAVGVSGISQMENTYLQSTKSLKKYKDEIDQGRIPIEKVYFLNKEEKITRDVINELMCNLYLDWGQLGKKYGLSAKDIQNTVEFSFDSLKDFINEGLVEMKDENISITDNGKFFIRNIVACFDPKMKNNTKNFSKAL